MAVDSGWLNGPVTEICGVHAFWVARGGAALQFVSGLAIITELVGHDRIERFGASVSGAFARVAQRRLNDLPFRWARTCWEIATGDRYPGRVWRMIMSGVALLALCVLGYLILFTQTPLSTVTWVSYPIVAITVGWFVIAMVLAAMAVIVSVLEFFFDRAIALALAMTRRTTTTRALLFASVMLFILGFALQMAAS